MIMIIITDIIYRDIFANQTQTKKQNNKKQKMYTLETNMTEL
jgi:hypothetical protein